jgi:2-amino-4-hydroxy-6-hydroxymethyldihydropteridine diphosphokinase / dihydropteroate synthase
MVVISIGTNLGNRIQNIYRAVNLLKKRCFGENLQSSIVLETKAILPEYAPPEWDIPYFNSIVWGETHLSPESLLKELKEIECEFGRPHFYERWAPRILDLDILLWDDRVLELEMLKIPHLELCNRNFLIHLLAMYLPFSRYPKVKGELSKYAGKNFLQICSLCSESLQDCFVRSFVICPQLVGVVNITPDSFSDGGQFLSSQHAIKRARDLVASGAGIIELGAQSTRPTLQMEDFVSPKQEYDRLNPVLLDLSDDISNGKIAVSIDSFSSEVVLKILSNYSIRWVNDVKGAFDKETLCAIADARCGFITMHSLSIPPKRENSLSDEKDLIKELLHWAKTRVQQLLSFGFSHENIVLDPGIGFGKTMYQNLYILRNMKIFVDYVHHHLGCRVLCGHSRKSFMTTFSKYEACDRDIETLSISQDLASKGVDFIRVHDIEFNHRALSANHTVNYRNGDEKF